MAEKAVRNVAVGEDLVDAPNSEDRIAALQSITSVLKVVSDSIDDVPKKIPEHMMKDVKFKESFDILKIVKRALEEFKYLLESPLGRESFDLVWRQRKSISALIHVGTQFIGAASVVIIMQDLMDVKDNEFAANIESIAKYIQTVDDMLPAIKLRITTAVDNLKKFQEDCSDKKLLEAAMRAFEIDIRFARIDINECKEYLRISGDKIQECMNKITGIRWRYYTVRALGLGAAGMILFGSVKSAKLSKDKALIIGAIAGGLICYGKIPRYKQLYENLRKHKEAQIYLELEVKLLEERLDAAIILYGV